MSIRKILHAADIHLDSPMRNLEAYPDAPVEAFRGASRKALSNLVDLAIAQRVDLVVIAGDLYDDDWNDAHTGLFFAQQSQRLVSAAIPLVVIRGNHDANSVMTQSIRLPANPDGSSIMLAHDQVDRRLFPSLGIAVHGRSFAHRAETSDLSLQYPAAISGMFNLGLLHTCLTGSEGHENYAPTSPQKLADKGYDYWALGHIHDRRECQQAGQPPIVFSGNIQGRHVRETGAKGCLILDVDTDNRVSSEFHPLDAARWAVFEHDASDDTHTDDLLDAFTSWLDDEIDRAAHRPLAVRTRVTGATTLHGEYHGGASSLENQLRAIAMQRGGGQVWIEQLRLRTTRPTASRPLTSDSGITDEPPGYDHDGAYDALRQVVTGLRTDKDQRSQLAELLKPLRDRLPADSPNEGERFDFGSEERIDHWIDQSESELINRLRAEEQG